jgi:MSHA pilin protein MshC
MHRAIQRGRRRFGGQGGFTLFEVVVVLLILGVISYFAATRLFSGDALSQDAEMELVKNHLRYAQSRAMNTETNWGLLFEMPSKYLLYYENESGSRVAVRLPGDDTSPETGPEAKKMQLKTLSISSIANSLWPNEVRFYCGSSDKASNRPGKFGSPSTSSEGNDITINTSAGAITIKTNTGFIP